ncbi:MAG: hypothetical protein ACRCZ2_09030 [Fusobacteriaceae bacterium]
MSEMTTKKRAAFSLPTREVACPDCGQVFRTSAQHEHSPEELSAICRFAEHSDRRKNRRPCRHCGENGMPPCRAPAREVARG